jgi:hypothetical protein
MTYYEELGLGPRADAAEIHQAYRHLVRLLHPDQQAEPGLRHLAEAQMRRLNLVHETLADPARRRQYDASLAVLPPVRARTAVRLRSRPLLAGATLGAICLLLWHALDGKPAGVPAAPVTRMDDMDRASDDPAPSAPKAERLRRTAGSPRRPARIRATPGVPAAAPERILLEPEPATPFVSPVVPLAALPAITAPPLAASVSPETRRTEADPRFSGTWVYIPPRLPPNEHALYPPEYVEAVIQDTGEAVRGRYRARYRVPDRPISPEVAFRFEGPAQANPATLTWNGAGGAKGELKLTLLPSGSLQLDWLATALGKQLGLGSGTAVLTRRQSP